MRDNMLISVMGHQGHYMGVDLNMEHNVGFQKVFLYFTLHLFAILITLFNRNILREREYMEPRSTWRTSHP